MDMMREARRGGSVYAIGFAKGMSNEGYYFLLAVFLRAARADGFTVKCGGYTMVANQGELSTINGERVTSQNHRTGTNGLKVDMGLMPKTVTTTALNTFVAWYRNAIPECPTVVIAWMRRKSSVPFHAKRLLINHS